MEDFYEVDRCQNNRRSDEKDRGRRQQSHELVHESWEKRNTQVLTRAHFAPLLIPFTLVVGMHSMLQSPATSGMPRRRGMATSLRIESPAKIPQIALALGSDGSDSDYPPPQNKPRRNMKKLSLLLPSAQSSLTSLQSPLDPVTAIPTNPTTSLLLRKDEDGGSPSVPYIDGPVQIIPGIWIGSEDNACDWKGLVERGIRSVLNVAKEVTSPFDSLPTQPFRHAISTPNLRNNKSSEPTYCPPLPTGRPAMYYLQLQWSHGQQNLVNDGFQAGIAFADAARNRGEGCLIQYVFFCFTRFFHSNQSPTVANAVFRVRLQWSSPSLCVPLPSKLPGYPQRFGHLRVCKGHTHL